MTSPKKAKRKKGKRTVVEYSPRFEKNFRKAPVKIQQAFRARLIMRLRDPQHAVLRDHSLKGKYKGYRSFNVTGDWRAVYAITKMENTVSLRIEDIGTHSQLYK